MPFTNPNGIYDTWKNNELISIAIHKEYTDFPQLNPPTQLMSIFDSSINAKTLNTERDKDSIDVTLTSPIYGKLIDKRLTYNLRSMTYIYKIRFKPTPVLSTGKVISHIDLPNKLLGVSLLLPDSYKAWKIIEINFLNALGFKTKVELASFQVLGKPWPEITMFGSIE